MDTSKLMALMAQKKQAMKRVERAAGFAQGKNRIRILPGWRAGEEHVWFHDFGQHFIKDAADQIQAVYPCVDVTYGKPCAVCDAIRGAGRLITDDDTQKIVNKANAGRVMLCNALMLDATDPNTPVVLALKPKLFAQLTQMIEDNGPEAFFDLEQGHEIIVVRDGKGLLTTYTGQMSIKVGTPIPAAVLKKLHNLDEYVKQESEEQERRAIAAVNGVAGLLTQAPGDVPTTTATRLSAPAAAAAPALAAPAAPARADVALDEELDSLLGDLPQ